MVTAQPKDMNLAAEAIKTDFEGSGLTQILGTQASQEESFQQRTEEIKRARSGSMTSPLPRNQYAP